MLLRNQQYSVGNSDAIICIASEISALRFMLDRDVNSRTPNGLNPIYQAKADEILQKIHDNPAIRLNDEIVDSEEDFDSVQALSGMAAQEAWRHAALIHYYHSLYRGCARYEHAAQASCQQILKLFTIIQLGRPHRLFGLYGLPIFMAATVAEKLEDQKACLDVFEKLSLKCAMDREIVAFFERIWGDSEKVGRRVEWLDYTSVETGPVFM